MLPFAADKQHYLERVKANILPLSQAKILELARFEWQDTGKGFECEPMTCGLCLKEDLRRISLIRNQWNGNELWIGSECIKKFYSDDVGDDTVAFTEVLKEKQQRMLWTLQELNKIEPNELNRYAASYFEDRGCLTPKLATGVLWRLRTHGIPYNISDFNINMTGEHHAEDLVNLEEFQIGELLPALSKEWQNYVMGEPCDPFQK